MKNLTKTIIILITMGLFSCKSIPDGAVAVKPFDLNKYLGTWYEIARFDYSFEKNLNNTTATYSLNEDGTVKVFNRGYNYVNGNWQDATGKAKFRGSKDVASLKVSFFGPFYGGYNVIALDADYQYALIAGSSTDYIWILSREKTLPEDVKKAYLEMAEKIGFDIEKLIWVEHK
jgi:apolipoprotein D and lipocalin family protein